MLLPGMHFELPSTKIIGAKDMSGSALINNPR